MVSRRFMPPDSGSTSDAARSESWTNVSSSSARRTATSRGMSKYRAYISRFSRTVSSASRLSVCGTTPSRALIALACVRGSMPNTRSSPSVTGDAHPIIRIVDVLPAPLGPRKPNASPARTSKSMPSTAVKAANRFVRRRARTSGSPATMVEGAPHRAREQGCRSDSTLSASYRMSNDPERAAPRESSVCGEERHESVVSAVRAKTRPRESARSGQLGELAVHQVS